MIEIVAEQENHRAALEPMLDRAFGPGRLAKTSERVRENGAVFEPALSRVALENGAPIGCCRIWRIGVGAEDALFLGPLAVDPLRQHGGLGARLVRETMAACARTDYPAVILIGAPAFFKPLGFTQIDATAITMPGPIDAARFLMAPLSDSARCLRGAVTGPRDSNPAATK